jgi:hypothetical protein
MVVDLSVGVSWCRGKCVIRLRCESGGSWSDVGIKLRWDSLGTRGEGATCESSS